MNNALLITAAGNSSRYSSVIKKEYEFLINNQVTVLSKILDTFLSCVQFEYILITIPPNDEKRALKAVSYSLYLQNVCKKNPLENLLLIPGNRTRQESVFSGLKKIKQLEKKIDYVFIHDGARPWISKDTIVKIFATAQKFGAAVPVIPSIDTQKEVSEEGEIIRHLPRKSIFNVQTPQIFQFEPLFAAYKKVKNDLSSYTDDSEIWAASERSVYTAEGCIENKKITFKDDLQTQ